jgi:hypothetical protein
MLPATTSKSFLTALNLIYFSLVFVMATFGLVVLYLNFSGGVSAEVDDEFTTMLRYILLAALPIGLGAGYFLFKQLIGSPDSSTTLREKLFKYQNALLIRSAFFEIPGLLGAVCALITMDNSFLLFTGIAIVMFFLFRPTVYSITADLNLSQADRLILENPQSPLI